MKRILSAALVLACLALTGCAIVPAGPYYGGGHGRGYGGVAVAPAVVVPAPIVVQPYYGWGRRPWRGGY